MQNDGNGSTPDAIRAVLDGEEQTEETTAPFIHVTFGSAVNEVDISMTNVSPFMLWGAAAMINKYAQDLWDQNQMREMMEQQAAAAAESGRPSGIVPVRTLDHLPKRRN